MAYTGYCNNGPLLLSVGRNFVRGSIAGRSVSLLGSSALASGRVGTWRFRLFGTGTTIAGTYGNLRVFATLGDAGDHASVRMVGRIGAYRLACLLTSDASDHVSIGCQGQALAEALIPRLAQLLIASQ